MSNRERWVIYPLLFMTLGMTVRSRVLPPQTRTPGVKVGQVDALDIQCGSLTVNDITVTSPDGETRLRIGVTPSDVGQVEIYKGSRERVALIGADQSGQSGWVEVSGPDGHLGTYIGFREKDPGLFVHAPATGRDLRLVQLPPLVAEWLKVVRKSLEPSEDP